MRLKILKAPGFINLDGFNLMPPIGISKIFSVLRNEGFDISQEDLNVLNHHHAMTNRKRLLQLLLNKKRLLRYLHGGSDGDLENFASKYLNKSMVRGIDILLISVFGEDFCSSMASLLIARNFKNINYHGIVIIGGEARHRAYIHEKFGIYNKTGVLDYYILGPGEASLFMLVKKILKAAVVSSDIPGLCYKKNNRIYKNACQDQAMPTVASFDGLALKEYAWNKGAFFQNISSKKFSNTSVLILPFQMAYGCPNQCAFCVYANSKMTRMNAKNAVFTLKNYVKKYGARHFFFLENTFNFSQEFVNDFCDEIFKTGLKIYWSVCASVKHINNRAILLKMRKAGACRLVYGLETASPRLLNLINKTITPDQAAQALRWSHEAGIWTAVEIIAGLPHEKIEDIYATANFINTYAPYLDEIFLNRFHLMHGSPMHLHPDRYRITNIREYKGLSSLVKERREHFRYTFDEINGLKWRDKGKQTEFSYRFIHKILVKNKLDPMMPRGEELNVLFYLYTHLRNKEQIRSFFDRYQQEYLANKNH